MTEILIWGTGSRADRNYTFAKKSGILEHNKIIGFIDNDSKKWGKSGIDNIHIFSPDEIKNLKFDYICIWSTYKKEISKQLVKEFDISIERQRDILKQYFISNLENKYYLLDNLELKQAISDIKNADDIYIYNFLPKFPYKLYEAFYDKLADLYYIYFEDKRLYMKRGYPFIIKNGNKYVQDIWYEQDPNSPHLYEYGDIKVCDGDILVDAGVCEGNFSLHHIENVKKVYLVECNDGWIEALKHTFAPYNDKVVFCNKFLSNIDSEEKISLDSLLLGEKISF